jgi:aspartate/methionine/tyrosine aminotransferase
VWSPLFALFLLILILKTMFLSGIEGSPSLEVVNLVLQKRSRGEKVVSLAIGDPEANTPKEIEQAAYLAMESGEVHYVPSYGTPGVRRAISSKVRRRNGIKAEEKETIFITTKMAVYASLFAISEIGYEALVPNPGYFYSEPVILSGGRPVSYDLTDDFSLDMTEIKKKTTDKTKAILVNSPSNPTGRVLEKGELQELYDFCCDRAIYVVSDEAYEDLVYDGVSHFAVGSLEQKPDRVISIFSLSKSYAMTGWRAGYLVASENVIYLVNKFLENTVTCFPPFIQRASEYALDHGDAIIEAQRNDYTTKRKLTVEKLSQLSGVEVNDIQGTFYAFPKFRSNNLSSTELSKRLLSKENVAVLPGAAFGEKGEGRIRISFSERIDELEDGLERIGRFLSDTQ